MLQWVFKTRLALLSLVGTSTTGWSPISPQPITPSVCPHQISHHLAQYSPWFPAGEYPPVPEACYIDQVNILHRHGARWPTSGAGEVLRDTLEAIKQAINRKGPTSTLYWMVDYSYTLKADDLVHLGKIESLQSGTVAAQKYAELAVARGIFLRASSRPRVVQTALYWRKAFAAQSKLHVKKPIVISDGAKSNDTLANNDCPAHHPIYAHGKWAQTMSPLIAQRLQDQVVNYRLQVRDIIVLLTMCAFDSVATGRCSKFCDLFTDEEILDYEYFNDLEKYYNTGYGNPLGPVQGVGYVNELLARLQDSSVEDETQTNSTLDRDERTFPLERGVYADFSHDNTMAAIVSALGLFKQAPEEMPVTHRPAQRAWRFGHIAPFAGRIVVERLQCATAFLDQSSQGTHSSMTQQSASYVRIIANDALQSLEFCNSGQGDTWASQRGLCKLEAFVESQSFARIEGQEKWKKCFV